MFDAGTCAVVAKSQVGAGTLDWSGTLGKGDTSGDISADGRTFTVSVTADGVLVLTADTGDAGGIYLTVVPHSDATGLLSRITGISCVASSDLGFGYYGIANPPATPTPNPPALQEVTLASDGTSTPDTCEFPAFGSDDQIVGFYAQGVF
jgi:hypothetical protein